MADEENEEVENLPEESGSKAVNPWIPVAVVVILLPVLSFLMTEFFLIPRVKSELAIASGGEHENGHGEASGGGGKQDAPDSGGHGGGDVEGADYGVYEFSTIKTNLSRPNTSLIIVKFTIKGEFSADVIESHKPELIDATLKRLSLLTRVDCQTPGIQNVVKSDLISSFNGILGSHVVENLYFIDFVTQ